MNIILSILGKIGIGALAKYAVKLVFGLAVVTAVVALGDLAVTALDDYLSDLDDPTVGGYVVPVVSMAAYMGVFQGIGILLGALLAVRAIKLAFKVVDWVG